MLEFMDGFGAHLISEEANTIRFNNKILSLKEEGYSSSINQAYDKYVSKEYKRIQCNNFRQWKSNINNQWGLMHYVIATVRYTTMHPHLWVNAFISVNMKPTERIPFDEWWEKISAHMQLSYSFYLVLYNYNSIDKYLLLPDIWQAMSTEHKTEAV